MVKGKKAAFYTLGCKLNFSETSTIGRQLSDIGFSETEFELNIDFTADFSLAASSTGGI